MANNKKQRDEEFAKFMKAHPNRYPDSIMRPGQGEGKSIREIAKGVGSVPNTGKHYMIGMMGGILAYRLGFKSNNIPAEFLS